MSIAASGNRNEKERQAMEVAEDAREQTWEHPSFCAELFAGNFKFDYIYPFPGQSPEDIKAGDEYIEDVMSFLKKNHDPLLVEKTKKVPPDIVKGLAERGAFGLKIPKEYEGKGFSQQNYNRIMAAITSYCSSIGALLSAHQSIGVPVPVKMFGTEEQKKRFLPRVARGAISAFALTEAGVGSDPAKMQTKAEPTEDGKHWILNGEKLWCTNGTVADLIVVMAATPPKILSDGREKKQITAFIVEKDMPGFEVVHRCDFMGLKGIENGLLRFKNVKVPAENVIWGVGKGLKLALITLNTGRLTIPASCTATSKVCLAIGRTWASEREQWGAKIGEHETPATRLVLSAGAAYTNESVSQLTAGLADKGDADIRIEASIAKLFTTGLGWRVIDNAFQLRGGRAYETAESLKARGEDAYPMEKIMRDFRINMIVEGTSGIQRLFVSREALDKHLKLAGGIFNPKLSVGQKIGLMFKAAAFYAFWYPRLWLPVFWPMYSGFGSWEGRYLRLLAGYSKRLARTTFHVMMVNGPKLEKKQNTLARIVDAGSGIFVLSAVLSRFLTRKKAGKLETKETELVKMICYVMATEIKSDFRKIKKSSHKAIVGMSRAIMEGRLKWLETGIADHIEMGKADKSRTAPSPQPAHSAEVVAGK